MVSLRRELKLWIKQRFHQTSCIQRNWSRIVLFERKSILVRMCIYVVATVISVSDRFVLLHRVDRISFPLRFNFVLCLRKAFKRNTFFQTLLKIPISCSRTCVESKYCCFLPFCLMYMLQFFRLKLSSMLRLITMCGSIHKVIYKNSLENVGAKSNKTACRCLWVRLYIRNRIP